ncbi:type II toxin-antitoxin system ParD family antitoxin [Chamaesiphon sp.]|uniref:ribbon-helix-helix domain-containing protein n=1 Tax=Chamaesiphon sp. TaxID=2814140 RepID=UPI0035935673
MTYLTIALPEAMKDYVVVASPVENRQVASGVYSTADEFLTALILHRRGYANEQEQERQAKQKVNAMLRSTLQKNKTVEATDEWWEQQHQYLTEQLPPQT